MPTVQEEYSKIKIEKWKKEHEDFHNILLLDINPLPDSQTIDNEKNYYLQFHNKEKDCKIVAEAEISGLDYFLTCDEKFYINLHENTKHINIMKADEFWITILAIPKGSKPVITPHSTNPLYGKEWWKW